MIDIVGNTFIQGLDGRCRLTQMRQVCVDASLILDARGMSWEGAIRLAFLSSHVAAVRDLDFLL